MDRDGVVARVEHNDLEQTARAIGTDHQHPILALEHEAQRDTHRSLDVLVGNSMPSSTARDLHVDRLPCHGVCRDEDPCRGRPCGRLLLPWSWPGRPLAAAAKIDVNAAQSRLDHSVGAAISHSTSSRFSTRVSEVVATQPDTRRGHQVVQPQDAAAVIAAQDFTRVDPAGAGTVKGIDFRVVEYEGPAAR